MKIIQNRISENEILIKKIQVNILKVEEINENVKEIDVITKKLIATTEFINKMLKIRGAFS
jgi:hypothetical protein